ncbi:hypothetical protein [Palleronia rufa]|uniref:hypothetical protein n=1 Tax=Palleronia rufa TaxID=1530186 RepID=UPI001267EE08|nr:hypothetical protein [Palleronia rufa]
MTREFAIRIVFGLWIYIVVGAAYGFLIQPVLVAAAVVGAIAALALLAAVLDDDVDFDAERPKSGFRKRGSGLYVPRSFDEGEVEAEVKDQRSYSKPGKITRREITLMVFSALAAVLVEAAFGLLTKTVAYLLRGQ